LFLFLDNSNEHWTILTREITKHVYIIDSYLV
jgi:hypothetical protein